MMTDETGVVDNNDVNSVDEWSQSQCDGDDDGDDMMPIGDDDEKLMTDECSKTRAGRPRRRCFVLYTTLMKRLHV